MPDETKGTLGLRQSPYTIDDEAQAKVESDVERFMTMQFNKERGYILAQMPIAKARAFARIKSDKQYVRFGVSSQEINEANTLMAYAGRHSIDNAREVAMAQAGNRNPNRDRTDFNAVAAPPPKGQQATEQQKGK